MLGHNDVRAEEKWSFGVSFVLMAGFVGYAFLDGWEKKKEKIKCRAASSCSSLEEKKGGLALAGILVTSSFFLHPMLCLLFPLQPFLPPLRSFLFPQLLLVVTM